MPKHDSHKCPFLWGVWAPMSFGPHKSISPRHLDWFSHLAQLMLMTDRHTGHAKGKGNPYSITEHRVLGLILVLGSQPAGKVSHKPGGRLLLISARPAVTPVTLKRAATNFAAW